jgi:hypothetical protein
MFAAKLKLMSTFAASGEFPYNPEERLLQKQDLRPSLSSIERLATNISPGSAKFSITYRLFITLPRWLCLGGA